MAVDIEHPSNNFTRRVFFRVDETKTNKFGLSESKETGLQPLVPVIKNAAFQRLEDVAATCPFYPPEKRAERSLLKEAGGVLSLFSSPTPSTQQQISQIQVVFTPDYLTENRLIWEYIASTLPAFRANSVL